MKHPLLVLVSGGVELPFENQRSISFSPIRLHRCTHWVVYSHSKAIRGWVLLSKQILCFLKSSCVHSMGGRIGPILALSVMSTYANSSHSHKGHL